MADSARFVCKEGEDGVGMSNARFKARKELCGQITPHPGLDPPARAALGEALTAARRRSDPKQCAAGAAVIIAGREPIRLDGGAAVGLQQGESTMHQAADILFARLAK